MKKTLALAWLALVVAGCGGGDAGSGASGPIRIGAIFDLTGPTSDVGKDYADAMQGWVEWTNGQGGIGGRPIELMFQDYAYQTDRAEQLYSQFVQQGAVVFMGWGTGDTEALRLRIADDRIPFSSASLSDPLGDPSESPYNFLVATTYSDQFLIVLDWIVEDYASRGGTGAPTVALMHNASPFGLSPWVNLGQDRAAELGLDVTLYEMPRGATDYTAEMTRIRSSGADYIVIQNTSAPAAVAIRNARSLGLDARVVCLNWCSNRLLIDLAGPDAEGTVGAMPFAPPTHDAAGLADIRAYLASKGESIEDRTNAYTQGWWTFEVFGEALRRVTAAGDELTGENIRAALESIRDFDTGGVTVPISFSPDDHRGSKGLRLYRVEDGAWTPITGFLSAPAR